MLGSIQEQPAHILQNQRPRQADQLQTPSSVSPPPSLPRDRNTLRVPCTIQSNCLLPCSLLHPCYSQVPSLVEHMTNIPMSVPAVPPDTPTPTIASHTDIAQVLLRSASSQDQMSAVTPTASLLYTDPTLRALAKLHCNRSLNWDIYAAGHLYGVYGF